MRAVAGGDAGQHALVPPLGFPPQTDAVGEDDERFLEFLMQSVLGQDDNSYVV